MNHIFKAVSALFILALSSVSAHAHNKVVVIPMGDSPSVGYCPAAKGINIIGGPADVSTWFFENGNPGGWNAVGGGTGFHSLGYGYESSSYYGKCSTGGGLTTGAYPGELNDSPNHNTVCLVV